MKKNKRDIHSFSRPDEAVVSHLDLKLNVDFLKKELAGKASLSILNLTGASQLYLDSRDLIIDRVTLGTEERKTSFHIGDSVKYLGSPFVIDIGSDTKLVHIYYKTSPHAAALQWLDPGQTSDGKNHFLFTQSQASLARTWVPCQDTPGVRMTYTAQITVPQGLMAVMSAENSTQRSADGVYKFRMLQPIPSYLIALAVGDIDFRSTGTRSGVYAEPSFVEKAAWEFAETDKMIEAAEKLYGPYRWGRYDLMVLPPSFPYGGMENPRLTFTTTTVIAGDRSLVSLVAHELAHSWSGNLVTNATWEDFWLNEGFTTYFQHRIMEALYGRDYDEMQAVIGYQDLEKTISEFGKNYGDSHLKLNLQGRDPDDSFSAVAYQKGYFFLRTIEETVGRPLFDSFVRNYFERHAFQSVTTEEFLAELQQEVIQRDPDLDRKLQLNAWVYGPGIPPNSARPHSSAFSRVEQQIQLWSSGTPAVKLDTKQWSTHEWIHFLRHLPAGLKSPQMAELDDAFQFSKSGNAEIMNEWLINVIQNEYKPAYPILERFLLSQGRRKYLKPLYGEMAKTPAGLELAGGIYAKARSGYHPVSVWVVDSIFDDQTPKA